jgi:tRNA(Ser,Leu) C12 N-acetylase TAN1
MKINNVKVNKEAEKIITRMLFVEFRFDEIDNMKNKTVRVTFEDGKLFEITYKKRGGDGRIGIGEKN